MEAHASALQKTWQKRTLALCRLSYALSYLCRTNLSIALPEMTARLHGTAAKAGVIGSAFLLVTALDTSSTVSWATACR